MTCQRSDQEDRRLEIRSLLGEMDQRREGGGHHDLLSHNRVHAADPHLVEAEARPFVSETSPLDHFEVR